MIAMSVQTDREKCTLGIFLPRVHKKEGRCLDDSRNLYG